MFTLKWVGRRGHPVARRLFVMSVSDRQMVCFRAFRPIKWSVVVLLLCGLSIRPIIAQNPNVFSQYFMNPYVYNPALAGVEGHNAVFLMYRRQWVGLAKGIPQISHINWHTPLRHAGAIGVQLANDRIGPLTATSFKFTYAHLINLDLTHFFRLGISLGGGHEGVDVNGIIGDGPLSARYAADLANYRTGSAYFLADVGVMYHFGHFNVGISLPELLGRRILNTSAVSTVRFSPLDHFFFKTNYRQSLFNDVIAIDPHLLYRYSKAGSSQYEVSLVIHIAHVVWVGVSHRQHVGFVGLLGFKINRSLGFGYAYDIATGDLGQYAGSTHEIHVGIHIGRRFGHVVHVSSFLKSARVKTDEEDDALEGDLEDTGNLPALPDDSGLPAGGHDGARLPDDSGLPAGGHDGARLLDDSGLPAGGHDGARLPDDSGLPAGDHDGARLPDDSGLPAGDHDGARLPDDSGLPAGGHDGARLPDDSGLPAGGGDTRDLLGAIAYAGEHPIELPIGSYVIVGAFTKYANAVRYSEYFLRHGYVARLGYNSEREYYYVDMFYSKDVYAVRARRDQLRKISIFADAWVLTVIKRY